MSRTRARLRHRMHWLPSVRGASVAIGCHLRSSGCNLLLRRAVTRREQQIAALSRREHQPAASSGPATTPPPSPPRRALAQRDATNHPSSLPRTKTKQNENIVGLRTRRSRRAAPRGAPHRAARARRNGAPPRPRLWRRPRRPRRRGRRRRRRVARHCRSHRRRRARRANARKRPLRFFVFHRRSSYVARHTRDTRLERPSARRRGPVIRVVSWSRGDLV